MSEHAFLAPSSAFRWVRCALAPTLEAAYPETEPSPKSLEGTAAHWVVEMLLKGTPAAIGMQAPNGVEVTDEMTEGAQLVLDDVVATLGPNWQQMIAVERRVNIPSVHPTHNWGTPDITAWQQGQQGYMLYVDDYKFGHDIVEHFENWQIIDYVAGKLDEAREHGITDEQVVVDAVVIQPRAYHREGPVRHWRVRATELRGLVNQLRNAAEAATGLNPTATPTPEGCENCRGRHACEALQREAYKAADKGKLSGAYDLEPFALGLELRELTRAQDLLKARVSGLQAQAEATIRRGVHVPFWAMESVPGKLKWTKPNAEVIAVGEMMGVKIAKDPEPMTPTQAKKAGLPDSIVNLYAARPPGAVSLTYDDGAKARKVFSSPS